MKPKEFWKSTLRHLYLLRAQRRYEWQEHWRMTRNIEYRVAQTAIWPNGNLMFDDLKKKSDLYQLDGDLEAEAKMVEEIKANIPTKEEFEVMWEERKKILEERLKQQ